LNLITAYPGLQLGDFGISKDLGQQADKMGGTMVGTPFYMSPELLQEISYLGYYSNLHLPFANIIECIEYNIYIVL